MGTSGVPRMTKTGPMRTSSVATPADPPAARHTLFATGGHCAIRRDRFIELGGFDDLLKPFYCEDLDLCYRVKKAE